jgi:hypothetical protein
MFLNAVRHLDDIVHKYIRIYLYTFSRHPRRLAKYFYGLTADLTASNLSLVVRPSSLVHRLTSVLCALCG